MNLVEVAQIFVRNDLKTSKMKIFLENKWK